MANPPPPYADITGITRAVMKDNAQESIANYDGHARPGELVVQQNTNNLYVGDTNGNLHLLANASATKFYGSFVDTSTQTNTDPGNAIAVTYDTTVSSNNISIVDNSKITMALGGVYDIQFSLQIEKTDAGTDTGYFWLSKNGNAVPYTNTAITLVGNNAKTVAAWNFVEVAASGDYYELYWGSTDPNFQIVASASPALGPAIPSVILTVAQI